MSRPENTSANPPPRLLDRGTWIALAAYAFVTAIVTYPMIARLHIMEPGDSAYFCWAMAWTHHALLSDPAALPHGNVYHPAAYALGMDEPILGSSILVLPLRLFTDDSVLLLNLLRLLIYTLCAFHAYLLARELGADHSVALFAGAAFSYSPMRIDQIGHLSTLGAQWLPLVLLFMHRFSRSGCLRHALAAAGFFLLAGYACGYHGLMGLVLLPFLAAVWLWPRVRLLPQVLLATAVVAIGFIPLRAMHLGAFLEHGFERAQQEVLLYSASLESFLATSSWNLLYGTLSEPFRDSSAGYLFPGLLVPAIVVWGVWRGLRARRRPTRTALGLAVLAFAAALFALGPEIRWSGTVLAPNPFGWLREHVGAFQMIRVNHRAGIFIALALPLLAARVLQGWRARPVWLAPALLVGVLLESWIAPIPIAEWSNVVDTRRPPPPVYAWLAEQPDDVVVAELPILPDENEFRRPDLHESIYMVYSTVHWKRIVNGYAGVDPLPHRHLEDVTRRFPSQPSLDALRDVGVTHVVLHRRGYGPNKTRRLQRDLPRFADQLEVVAQFDDDTVFRLRDRVTP